MPNTQYQHEYLDKLVKEVDDGDTGDKSDKHLEAQDCNIQYLLC